MAALWALVAQSVQALEEVSRAAWRSAAPSASAGRAGSWSAAAWRPQALCSPTAAEVEVSAPPADFLEQLCNLGWNVLSVFLLLLPLLLWPLLLLLLLLWSLLLLPCGLVVDIVPIYKDKYYPEIIAHPSICLVNIYLSIYISCRYVSISEYMHVHEMNVLWVGPRIVLPNRPIVTVPVLSPWSPTSSRHSASASVLIRPSCRRRRPRQQESQWFQHHEGSPDARWHLRRHWHYRSYIRWVLT